MDADTHAHTHKHPNQILYDGYEYVHTIVDESQLVVRRVEK